MRQTLHIFKKDVRHLWFEIAAAITVVVAFGFTGARRALWLADPLTNRTAAWTMVLILLPLTWWTLIARVIHDEALPGDRQFWITRPYSWKSLLGAKALFILAFINRSRLRIASPGARIAGPALEPSPACDSLRFADRYVICADGRIGPAGTCNPGALRDRTRRCHRRARGGSRWLLGRV